MDDLDFIDSSGESKPHAINPEVKAEIKTELKTVPDNCSLSGEKEDETDNCKDINKCLRQIRTLKRQNRIIEQQHLVAEMKQKHRSY